VRDSTADGFEILLPSDLIAGETLGTTIDGFAGVGSAVGGSAVDATRRYTAYSDQF